MTRRVERASEQLQHVLGQIIVEKLRDPRLPTLVTVTRVTFSPDLQYATIGLSFMGEPQQEQAAIQAMNAAKGFLKWELSRRLLLKRVPELRFFWDKSLIETARMASLEESRQSSYQKLGDPHGD